jgi:hypothetical protein
MQGVVIAGALVLAACGDDDGGAPFSAGADAGNSDSGAPGLPTTEEPAADLGGGPGAGGGGGTLPDDICGLLTQEEIDRVAPGAINDGQGVGEAGGVTNGECSWNSPEQQVSLSLIAGIPPEQVDMGIQVQVDDFNGHYVDIGDDRAGVYSPSEVSIELQMTTGDLTLSLGLIGTGASQMEDVLVELAHAAVDRLP